MKVQHQFVCVVLFSAPAALLLGRWLQADEEQTASSTKTSKVHAAAASQNSKSVPPLWHENIKEWKSQQDHDSADNYFCLVCHANYEDEKLVKTHQPVGVGCELCHGISDKHSEDEDNITPPEIMFTESRVMPFCMSCHDRQELMEEEDHDQLFAADAEPEKTCTECHARGHQLKVRTRKWDKQTGKLIWSDGVRMMEPSPADDQ